MRTTAWTILLSLCALGGTVESQTLPRLSDLGLAPIAAINYYCEEEEYSLSLEMDYEDGRVCQFHGQSSYSEGTVQFDPLQLTVVSEDMPEVVYKDIVLNDAGCATSWTACLGTQEFQGSATYNEKNQLIAIELEEGESCTLTWTDGNLTHYERHSGSGYNYDETFDITYTNLPSNGLIVQAVGPSFDEFGFFAFAGLLGVTSRNLPSQVVNRWDSDIYFDTNDYEYEFDEYGRVVGVMSSVNGGHTDYRRYTYAQDANRLNTIVDADAPATRKTIQGIVRTLPDGTQRVYDYLGR